MVVQVRSWNSALDELHKDHEQQTKMWVSSNTMACPRCHAHIQRNGGCNHMVCTACKQHFCYKCGKDWNGHVDYYNCSRGRPLSDADALDSTDLDQHNTAASGTLFSRVCTLFNSVVNGYWWEWHLQQYSAHDCDVGQLSLAGAYMSMLLELGFRGGDESKSHGSQDEDGKGCASAGVAQQVLEDCSAVCSASGDTPLTLGPGGADSNEPAHQQDYAASAKPQGSGCDQGQCPDSNPSGRSAACRGEEELFVVVLEWQ